MAELLLPGSFFWRTFSFFLRETLEAAKLAGQRGAFWGEDRAAPEQLGDRRNPKQGTYWARTCCRSDHC